MKENYRQLCSDIESTAEKNGSKIPSCREIMMKHCDTLCIYYRQRLWLRLGVNVDDQLWLRLNPIPILNCNPSAIPSPSPP